MNSPIRSDNTSGVRGVCWNKRDSKWVARITVNCQDIPLGKYDNFEDAEKARKMAKINISVNIRLKTNKVI